MTSASLPLISQIPCLEDIPHHGMLAALWLRLLRAQRLAHALLIDSPSSSTSIELVMALAQASLCHQPRPSGDACGQCASCRAMRSGVHADCLVLPDENELAEIPVDMVRDAVVAPATESALWAHGRVFVIPQVERLRPAAANALLKVMEEPPPGTRLLMTTRHSGSLLPTIRSRAQLYRVAQVATVSGEDIAAVPVASLAGIVGVGYDAHAIAGLMDQLQDAARQCPGSTDAAKQRVCLRRWLDAAVEDQRRQLSGEHAAKALAVIAVLLQARRDVAVNIAPRLVLEGLALTTLSY
ncbi:MAG: hypothetical protein EA401_07380 [Planctomycetota bacterium]|nr:MAG: hypothetical protein EA401_07380 [Planctomycetota bacterium]